MGNQQPAPAVLEALNALAAAARGPECDEPILYAARWLRALLAWCNDNEYVQQAIINDEDPGALQEHFAVTRQLADDLIAALDKLDAAAPPQVEPDAAL